MSDVTETPAYASPFARLVAAVYDLFPVVALMMAAGGLVAWHCLSGAAVAAVVGWLAIGGLIRLLGRGRFHWFGFYCVAAGAATFALLQGGF